MARSATREWLLITDKLRRYGVVHRELMRSVEQGMDRPHPGENRNDEATTGDGPQTNLLSRS
ncbi:hypothetical protein [Streptomyces hirsutus]|uniref:hypothetical protein n=1 Tax=Streptomyces hirsutus TaxID=35620 RepID=UPI00364C8DAE